MKSRLLFICVGMTLLLQPSIISPQTNKTQNRSAQEELRHEVDVVLKLIYVFVQDKEGNPVLDLEKTDFTLFDNGREKPITAFEKHSLKEAIKTEDVQKTETESARDVPALLKRKFLLVLDYYRNDSPGVYRAKEAALHFLDTQIFPTDEVAFFSYSKLKGLVLHENFTSDISRLKNSIETARGVPINLFGEQTLGPAQLNFLDSTTKNYMDTGALVEAEPEGPGGAAPLVIAESERVTAVRFAQQMRELAKYLRYVPGNKSLVFFSAGIPKHILYDLHNPEFRDIYQQTSKEFSSANVPVFTVDTAGMRSWLYTRSGPEGKDALKLLSIQSGGDYFHEVQYYTTIAEDIQKATSNFYILGYSVDEKWDGRYHDIKVNVNRKDCVVKAQKGYYNPIPFAQLSKFERNLQLIDLALNDAPHFQDPVDLTSIGLVCSTSDQDNVVLLSEIPVDQIKPLTEHKSEMAVLVFDEKENIVYAAQGDIDFSYFTEDVIYSYSILSLPPGRYACKQIIRNCVTGKAAVGKTSLELLRIPESGLYLFPPILMTPDKESLLVKVSKDDRETVMPSLSDIYRFFSDAHTPIVTRVNRENPRILAVMKSYVRMSQKPDIELEIFLHEESTGLKSPVAFSLVSAEKDEELDTLLLALELPELNPGFFTIEFVATDTSTGSKSLTERKIKIE